MASLQTLTFNPLHPTFGAECNGVDFRSSYPSCYTLADCLRTREIRRPCFPSCPAQWCPSCRICTAIRGAGWLNPIYKGRPQAPPCALYRALQRQQSWRWWQCRPHQQPALTAWFRQRTLPLRFILQSTTSRLLNLTSAWTAIKGYRRSDSVRGYQDNVWWPWHRPRRRQKIMWSATPYGIADGWRRQTASSWRAWIRRSILRDGIISYRPMKRVENLCYPSRTSHWGAGSWREWEGDPIFAGTFFETRVYIRD